MNKLRIFRHVCCSLAMLFVAAFAYAQEENDSTATGKAEANIELRYTEANNNTKILDAIVKTKVEGSYVGVPGVEVHFYRNEADAANLLGAASTNNKGRARLVLPQEKSAAPSNECTYIAVIEDNDKIEDNQEEVAITESSFEMTLGEEDSVREVHISLKGIDAEGNEVPVPDVDVSLYVQRMFGLLPLSEDPETTDEDGEVTVEFPEGIRGDTAGNIIIVAKVDDHELYGNLEFRRKINWGVPLVIDPEQNARALWASRANAPLYLIAIVNTMLVGIWGVILYIIYQAFRIKKVGKIA